MFTSLLSHKSNDFDYDDSLDYCKHGYLHYECDECDAILEASGGIDKCLNCGRYKSGNQLTQYQVCKIACRNPNEY